MSDRTYHEIAMEELARRLVEENQRDARDAATDPRNADQQGTQR